MGEDKKLVPISRHLKITVGDFLDYMDGYGLILTDHIVIEEGLEKLGGFTQDSTLELIEE